MTWDWGTDKVYGVNLGGWFVLEPFITPDLFQRFNGSRDEYELSVAMREGADGGIGELEEHYRTFIVSDVVLWRCMMVTFLVD